MRERDVMREEQDAQERTYTYICVIVIHFRPTTIYKKGEKKGGGEETSMHQGLKGNGCLQVL
jgi:hypothetical protein